MIIDYVTYEEETGLLTGSYHQELRPEHAAHHIVVTPEQRTRWVLYRANAARDGLESKSAQPVSIEQHNAPLLNELRTIDTKSIRALREGDAVRIAALEQQAVALRLKLRKA